MKTDVSLVVRIVTRNSNSSNTINLLPRDILLRVTIQATSLPHTQSRVTSHLCLALQPPPQLLLTTTTVMDVAATMDVKTAVSDGSCITVIVVVMR